MHLALIIQGRNGLRANHLAPAGVNSTEAHERVDRANCTPNHGAAIVYLRDNPVSLVPAARIDRLGGPFMRSISAGQILQNVSMPVAADTGDHDSGFVATLVVRSSGIDRHNDATQFRRLRNAISVKPIELPKCAWRICEHLGVDFLPTEARALVTIAEGLNERRCEIRFILERGAASNDDVLSFAS